MEARVRQALTTIYAQNGPAFPSRLQIGLPTALHSLRATVGQRNRIYAGSTHNGINVVLARDFVANSKHA
jgi:hypothetical protein